MARPPSTEVNETFLREVDEEYRRDRIRDFFVENRVLLIAALILFLVTAGGSIWWRDYRSKQTAGDVEKLALIYRDLGEGKIDQASKLEPLVQDSTESVQLSAIFAQAAIDLQKGDAKAATAKYKAVAEDSSYPDPFREIALIRQTSIEFDQLKPDEVIARMKPLAEPGAPWFGSAGEMTALALLKQGKKDDAAKMFAAVARDTAVPNPIRIRSIQIASTLGVDVSDAMPAAQ